MWNGTKRRYVKCPSLVLMLGARAYNLKFNIKNLIESAVGIIVKVAYWFTSLNMFLFIQAGISAVSVHSLDGGPLEAGTRLITLPLPPLLGMGTDAVSSQTNRLPPRVGIVLTAKKKREKQFMQHSRKSPKPRDFDSRAQHCKTCTASEIKFANFSRTRRLLCSISGYSLRRRRSVDCYERRPSRLVSAHHFICSFFPMFFFRLAMVSVDILMLGNCSSIIKRVHRQTSNDWSQGRWRWRAHGRLRRYC